MAPMDVDSEAHSGRNRTALIRAVRSLDEKDGLSLPEKVHKIWQLLSASKGTRLHSVEETIMRWLLKQMAGPSQGAEQVRRYPLTWTVLEQAFLKIPPQTLGRVLADRKFTSVLRQTLDDLSKSLKQPATEVGDAGYPTKKRKRGGEFPADIEQLRTHPGCVKTAVEVFRGLGSLLTYNDRSIETGSPEKRVGAEHIKSLFSSSTDETREITAKLLWICEGALRTLENGLSEDQRHWVGILTTLWDLHLHSKDDTYDFARHFYQPVCSMITKTKRLSVPSPPAGSLAINDLWLRQLEQFLGAQFIRPVRQRFAVDGSVEMLKAALAITATQTFASCNVLWNLAARMPRDSTDTTSKLEHASWAQNVFTALLEAIDSTEVSGKNKAIAQLLDIALTTGSIPNTDTLREVCKKHALQPGRTDWGLLAKVVKCDSDVFLMDSTMLENVLDAISSVSGQTPDQADQTVSEVTVSLLDAYTKARDLSGFIKQWYKRLSIYSNRNPKLLVHGVWFDVQIRQHLADILQGTLSTTQLVRLLDWLSSQARDHNALLVVLDGICASVTQEDYIRDAAPKIFALALQGSTNKDLPSEVAALRWRIAGYLASWEAADAIERLYTEVKPDLTNSLKTHPLSDPETLEAFKCSCGLLLANHPGGKDEAALTQLICTFVQRLEAALDSGDTIPSLLHYVEIIFRDFPKLAELPKPKNNVISDLIVALFRRIGQENDARARPDSQIRQLLRELIANPDVEDEESAIDTLISQPLDALVASETGCGWTRPQSISDIWTLLEFPTETLTRGRRKRIMSSWKPWRSDIARQASADPAYADALLRLLVKTMQQPTFYDKMEFDDLVHIASDMTQNNSGQLNLVERLIELTLKHVISNMEDFSVRYLGEASRYVEGLKTSKSSIPQMLLVKGLASALKNAPASKSLSTTIDQAKITRKLRKMAEHSLPRSSQMVAEGDETMLMLQVTLGAVDTLGDTLADKAIELRSETVARLEEAAGLYVSQGSESGWKLRKFLVMNYPDKYQEGSVVSWLHEPVEAGTEDVVYELVETYIKFHNRPARARLLNALVQGDKLTTGSIGPLLAVKKIIEQQEPANPQPSDEEGRIDLAAVHGHLAPLLTQATTARHFNHLSDALLLLLDKHAHSMTQFGVELTLGSVIEVCSLGGGPEFQDPDPRAGGQVYDRAYRLVAAVIRRQRRRLEGRFPLLVMTLQAMLRVLLADPSVSAQAYLRRPGAKPGNSRPHHPRWLTARLQARHAARFSRLLTLVCEPSAASVARHTSTSGSGSAAAKQQLDSATDAAKRAAGLDMYAVVESYIKLQLDPSEAGGMVVPREVRRALETGLYSVLDITPQGCRRVLNESLDANGRALFRSLYADYKKFGRWSGI